MAIQVTVLEILRLERTKRVEFRLPMPAFFNRKSEVNYFQTKYSLLSDTSQ